MKIYATEYEKPRAKIFEGIADDYTIYVPHGSPMDYPDDIAHAIIVYPGRRDQIWEILPSAQNTKKIRVPSTPSFTNIFDNTRNDSTDAIETHMHKVHKVLFIGNRAYIGYNATRDVIVMTDLIHQYATATRQQQTVLKLAMNVILNTLKADTTEAAVNIFLPGMALAETLSESEIQNILELEGTNIVGYTIVDNTIKITPDLANSILPRLLKSKVVKRLTETYEQMKYAAITELGTALTQIQEYRPRIEIDGHILRLTVRNIRAKKILKGEKLLMLDTSAIPQNVGLSYAQFEINLHSLHVVGRGHGIHPNLRPSRRLKTGEYSGILCLGDHKYLQSLQDLASMVRQFETLNLNSPFPEWESRGLFDFRTLPVVKEGYVW